MGKRKNVYFKELLPPDPVEKCPADCVFYRDYVCNYFLDTRELRGCEPGKNCEKYKRRAEL